MSTRMFSLYIEPQKVMEVLMMEVEGDLIYREYHQIKTGQSFGNIVFERVFGQQKKQREILVAMIQNVEEITNVTLITSSDIETWDFYLDCEVQEEWMNEVMEILDKYIISEQEI